jgi:serine/threonine protein kinase
LFVFSDHYLREAKTIREIGSGSDHIVGLFQAWQEEGHFFIQLEYCPLTLITLMRHQSQIMRDMNVSVRSDDSQNQQPISAGEAFVRRVSHDVAVGLVHVHAHNMVHLDIKPENILVATDGKLKIGDFGSAILKGMQADGSEGDAVYMAPELFSVRDRFS